MKAEEQRIAIAEACGFTIKTDDLGYKFGAYRPDGTVISRTDGDRRWLELKSYPDYLNDLNAMHEAEKTLKGMQCQNYQLWLIGCARGEHFIHNKTPDCYEFHATAAQRAEAFLRTIGKWVGS